MLTVLLCILFSKTLSFQGLTVAILLSWFNLHPFLAMLAVGELITSSVRVHHGSDK